MHSTEVFEVLTHHEHPETNAGLVCQQLRLGFQIVMNLMTCRSYLTTITRYYIVRYCR